MLYHHISVEEILKKLKTTKQGLTPEEAKLRYNKNGPNALPESKRFGRLAIFINQFKSVLIYVLLIAAGVSLFLGEIVDMSVILVAVVLNVVIGYFQENKAEESLAMLKKGINQKSLVVRDGKEIEIDSNMIVVGDLMILHAGDKISSDSRIINSTDLEVSEAALTGEAYSIKKNNKILPQKTVLADRKNMLYTGTVVIRGRVEAVVCSTGVDTEMGKIASLIKDTVDERTPLQDKLDKFSKRLGFIILFVTAFFFLFGVIKGKDVKEMFLTAIAVAVSAIPEGLVVAVTAILAIGMQKILREKALVRKLVAAETLGSITFICTDKTGTLTIGDMRVAKIITYNHNLDEVNINPELLTQNISPLKLLKIGVLSNDAHAENPEDVSGKWIVYGGLTEKALLLAGMQIGLKQKELKKKYPRLDEIPFDSKIKYMITLNKFDKTNNHLYLKGAPERVLDMCSQIDLDDHIVKFTDRERKKINQQFKNLSNQGLRILAFGYKVTSNDVKKIVDIKNHLEEYVFVGFVAIKDPLRPEAKETIKVCKQAGITPVMITGDHQLTAQAIAKELGIPSDQKHILTGEELEKLDEHDLKKIITTISVYARVTPADKIRIVQALQDNNEVVAMTGDGINDAPALKAADIGVALGSGTDVAKETADVVLLDNNFKTIISAIEQGRIIYANIKKILLYLLSDSFTELLLIVLALLVGAPLPILASQILWVNLIDDSLPSLALTMDTGDPNILKDKPQEKNKPILDSQRKFLIFFISIITGLVNFFLFMYLIKHRSIEESRTIIFTNIGMDSMLYVFSCRKLDRFIWNKNFFSNKYLFGAVGVGILLQLFAIYHPFFQKVLQTVPLSGVDWLMIITLNIGIVFIFELVKWFFVNKDKRNIIH